MQEEECFFLVLAGKQRYIPLPCDCRRRPAIQTAQPTPTDPARGSVLRSCQLLAIGWKKKRTAECPVSKWTACCKSDGSDGSDRSSTL